MDVSVSESVTIAEAIVAKNRDSLSQSFLGMVEDTKYRLMFDQDITTGILKAYQGSQLIFDSSILLLRPANFYDSIVLSENVSLKFSIFISVTDGVTVSEAFSKA